MTIWQKIQLYPKALRELGWQRSIWFARYQVGLISGYYRRKLKTIRSTALDTGEYNSVFHPFQTDQIKENSDGEDFSAADQLLQGNYRPYGGELKKLDFVVPRNDLDWSRWNPKEIIPGIDIKDIWEPARFGWAIHLARGYHACGNEEYARVFWQFFETFSAANPAYSGPNWISAQEVALRLIHLCASASTLWQAAESTPQRKVDFVRSIGLHAERIPVTLAYARAQNNNHLLSEAAGLFTAGRFLPDHPHAKQWLTQGWHEFEQGLLDQVEADGSYVQHSVCYHRLMLMLALWMNAIRGEYTFSAPVRHRLQAATYWLDHLTNGLGGKAANFGSNDGSRILPFTSAGVSEYQEVVDTCKAVFLADASAPWNELRYWLGYPALSVGDDPAAVPVQGIRRLDGAQSTGFLRAASFKSRPAHADQLHFDLWWQGINILRDPGTYRYNAPSPWDNQLSSADVHNVVTVDGFDQMTRAGKFLWLDWAQAKVLSEDTTHIYAQLTCPNQPGFSITRRVEALPNDTWHVTDKILPTASGQSHTLRIHWLLPDTVNHPAGTPTNRYSGSDTWLLDGTKLILMLEKGFVEMEVTCVGENLSLQTNLYRAGELLSGTTTARPTWGWYSPTYGLKLPALAWTVSCSSQSAVTIHTSIHLRSWPVDSKQEK